MSGEREDDVRSGDTGDDTPRNPFVDPEDSDRTERPAALIDTKRSAAVVGVVVGLVAMLVVVGICILGSIAFG